MLRRRLSAQSGQALVIAVLLLILLAVLTAVFVAFVSHTIAQSATRTGVEAAERMSVSGLLYAHRQLLTSSEQSNWRPALPGAVPPGYYEFASDLQAAFPPFVRLDDPAVAGDDPFSLGSAGQEQLGRCFLQVRYVPSAAQFAGAASWGTWAYPIDTTTGLFDELSPFIRITAVGFSASEPTLRRTKVAYVPLVLVDRLQTVVDSEETMRWASTGNPPWVDIDGDGQLDSFTDANSDGAINLTDPAEFQGDGVVDADEARELAVSRHWGGFHSNTSTIFYGRTWMNQLFGDRGGAIADGLGRGDRVTVAGQIAISNRPLGGAPAPAGWNSGVRFNCFNSYTQSLLTAAVYPTRQSLLAAEQTWPQGPPLPSDPTPPPPNWFPTWGGYVADNAGASDPQLDDAARAAGALTEVGRRTVGRVRAGLLDASDEAGSVRLQRFARESGYRFEVTDPRPSIGGTPVQSPGVYNTAMFGLGGTLYVDNAEDVQQLDPQALHDNWIHAGAQADAYWYGPVYVPPGCEVVFHESDIATDWRTSPPTDLGGPQRLYGNDPTIPDIELRRNLTPSGAPRYFRVPVTADGDDAGLADPADVWDPTTDPVGAIVDVLPLDVDPDDGIPDNHMVIDYPRDGCLYFEGNVRVMGTLPIARTDVLDASGYPRRYDVSLVSRQNIYVDGPLMRSIDWLPADPAWLDPQRVLTNGPVDPDGVPHYPRYVVQDRYAARVALLAEHNVVVNATRGEYQGPGIQTDCDYVPDVAEGSTTGGHWVLEPGKSFRTYFGWGGVDVSDPQWMITGAPADNPLSPARAAITGWDDDVFLKIRVRGSRLSAFNLLINNQPYDFDTRAYDAAQPPGPGNALEAAGVSPCRQMDGSVQTLYIPIVLDGQPVGAANVNGWEAPDLTIGGGPGQLNSVEIRPALGMTQPVDVMGISLERRDEVLGPQQTDPLGPPSGVPLAYANGASNFGVPDWFGWTPEMGPPPLKRAGGHVLSARTMTVAAACYAQKGSFFIIGGDWFDRYAANTDRDGDNRIVTVAPGIVDPPGGGGVWRPCDIDADRSGTPDWAEDRRHNLQVLVMGSVVQNLPPDMTCVADWTDKLSFPVPNPANVADWDLYRPTVPFWNLTGAAGSLPTGWCGPILAYDPGLRASNPVMALLGDPGPAPAGNAAQTVLRFARIPVSPDLVYFGDLTGV